MYPNKTSENDTEKLVATLAQSNYEILNRSKAETSETAEDVSSLLVDNRLRGT